MSHPYTASFTNTQRNLTATDLQNINNCIYIFTANIVAFLGQSFLHLKDSNKSHIHFQSFYFVENYPNCGYTFESNNQLTSNKLLALRKLCELFLGSTVNITQGMNSLQKTKFNFVFPNIDKSCLNFVTRTPINGVGQYTNDYIQNYIDQNIIQKLPTWIQKKIKSFTSTESINVRGRVDMLKIQFLLKILQIQVYILIKI